MKRLLYIVLLSVVVGCAPSEKFSVVGASVPTMDGLRSVHGKLTVESTARRDFMVERATVTVKYKGRELATARLMLPVVVEADRISKVRWDFALENTSLAALSALQSRLLSDPGSFTVDVNCRIRWGGFTKKIVLEELYVTAIMEMISNFDAQ